MFRPVVCFAAILSLASAAACNRPQPPASSPAAAASSNTFTGTVAEAMSSGGYTYARLAPAAGEDVWIAASEFTAQPGDTLTVSLDMPIPNFESKSLNRTFPLVYFVSDIGRGGKGASADVSSAALMTSHGARPASAVVVQPNAPPEGGLSVADAWARRASLAGTAITVRGTVVKVNNQIMERNWLHLQDGSGSAEDGTNDLTITTDAPVKAGDVVTFTGVLAVDRDFGSGYVYSLILEKARLAGN
jgi:hypothetical protein